MLDQIDQPGRNMRIPHLVWQECSFWETFIETSMAGLKEPSPNTPGKLSCSMAGFVLRRDYQRSIPGILPDETSVSGKLLRRTVHEITKSP